MKVDYSKTIIYKICCKDTSITDIYVGATTDMKSRKYTHKSESNNPNNKGYNKKVYKFIREHGGFSNWDMIMVEKYPCKDKLESGKRERYWMEELGATLNKQVPNRTPKEYKEKSKKYREDNKEKSKKYYEDNKEKIKEKSKKYREDNKETLKKYYEDNKEKIKETSKQYYEDNKEKIKIQIHKSNNIKYACICGSTIKKGNKARHERTQKHIDFINNQTKDI